MSNPNLKQTPPLPKRLVLNYIFGLFWTICLTGLTLLFTKDLFFSLESFFFFSLEACLILLVLFVLEKKFSFLLKPALFILSFLFLMHLISLLLLVLLDANLSFLYTMLFEDQASNFLVKIRATNLSSTYLFLIGLLVIGFPIAFYQLYCWTQRALKTLTIAPKTYVLTFVLISLCLLGLDGISYKFHWFDHSHKLAKQNLFLSFLRFSNSTTNQVLSITSINQHLADYISRSKQIQNQLKNQTFDTLASALQSQGKPPIFLFIVESLRADAINRAAPFLKQFKKENLSFKNAYANANCTHMAWFSIFFSELPIHWTLPQKQGALPLKILKKLGYDIEVFSSAELNYFNMKQKLFGKNLELTDSLQEFQAAESHERDLLTFKALMQKNFRENTLYIVFLDAPHSEYSHPLKELKFKPAASTLNYLKLALFPQEQAMLLKNRYLNCIGYLDSLFNQFFEHLKAQNIYQKALIVITGDHGEEFYEQGAFFHGSHLAKVQLKIPLMYKFPFLSDKISKTKCYTSQIDIFPTILHFLTGQPMPFLEGCSILTNPQKEVFSFNQNGGLDPVQFVITGP